MHAFLKIVPFDSLYFGPGRKCCPFPVLDDGNGGGMLDQQRLNFLGAAGKAANLGGCKSLCRQLPVNGRLAYPLLGEATNRDMRGRRSHGCQTRERRGGSNLGGEQISGPEDNRMTAAPRTQTVLKLL